MGKLNQLRVMMSNQGTGRENCYEKMRQFVRMIGGKLAMRIQLTSPEPGIRSVFPESAHFSAMTAKGLCCSSST